MQCVKDARQNFLDVMADEDNRELFHTIASWTGDTREWRVACKFRLVNEPVTQALDFFFGRQQ